MASARPLEDHSPQVNRLRGRYGGSDHAAPSFRKPEYVRFNSPTKAKDLGVVSDLRLIIQGAIGGINGTNTHFIRLTIAEHSRLAVRFADAMPCSIDWLCLHGADADLHPLPIGPSGFFSSDPLLVEPPATSSSGVIAAIPDLYVVDDYWEPRYAADTITLITASGTSRVVDYTTWTESQSASSTIAPGSFDELAARSQLADPLEPGTYYVLVTTSRWHDTPYTLQLLVAPAVRELAGELILQFLPEADTGVRQLNGVLDLAFQPSARLKDTINLGPDFTVAFSPVGGLVATPPIA